MKKIVFIPFGGRKTYSSRVRCYQIAEELRNLGWDCKIGKECLGRQDCVVFQKTYSPKDLQIAKKCKGKIIFDMCDPYWLRGHGKDLKRFIKITDYVVASSNKIAVWFRQRNKRTEVIPDGFDLKTIPEVLREEKLTIVWHGSRSNSKYLKFVVEPLNRLHREFDFNLKIIVDKPILNIPRFNFKPQIVDWRLETHLAEIAKCHIGVASLANDEWCSHKSINKPVSYMALGLPVVCSSIPSYEEIIESGKNGFLIRDNNSKSWYKAFKTLITSEEKRDSFIEKGKETAQLFTMEKITKKWDGLLRKLL